MRVLLSVCIILFLLSGCQANSDNDTNHASDTRTGDLQSNSIENLLKQSLKQKYKDVIKNVQIRDINTEDDFASIISFTCSLNDKEKLGLLIANKLDESKYELFHLELFDSYPQEKMTINSVYTELLSGSIRRPLTVILGFVYEPKIKVVNIIYPSNEVSGHVTEGQETYMDVKIGSNLKPVSVLGMSNDKIIFQKDY